MKSVLDYFLTRIKAVFRTFNTKQRSEKSLQESLPTEGLPLPRYSLSKRSYAKLEGVHPDLIAVVELAIKKTDVDFRVLEGLRTVTRQRMLVEAGASKTMNSRHLTGHAVDLGALLDGKISWDWPLYHKIAKAMKDSADELGIKITWGGDWKSFPDGPHFELSWKYYNTKDTRSI